ncbi:MAG: alpha/beta hydrolase-fold protein [Steroidobacteraceae bacterium]
MHTFSRLAPGLASALLYAAGTNAAEPQPATPATCANASFLPAAARFRSVEVLTDGRVTFKLCAPGAHDVGVTSSDMPDVIPFGRDGPVPLPMSKDDMGLWSGTTTKALAPDNYRYTFVVDGVAVADPQAVTFSRERVGTQSTLEVPGADGAFQSWNAKVPHGVVSQIEYWSGSLGVKRRAHVYTPPGYFRATAPLPVLYLVHGAGDSDDSWTSTGHAQNILDNLIAARKAKPMIVVMPFGHTPDRPNAPGMLTNTDFSDDLLKELIPAIDAQFRTIARPESRAMAGLSMGGSHTLRVGLTHPDTFRYIGVFSMGLGMNNNQADVATYEKDNAAALKQGARDFKLVYYAIGKDDFLYGTSAPTRAMLDRQGIKYVYNESGGGHTWINWRRYLADFAPRLF